MLDGGETEGKVVMAMNVGVVVLGAEVEASGT